MHSQLSRWDRYFGITGEERGYHFLSLIGPRKDAQHQSHWYLSVTVLPNAGVDRTPLVTGWLEFNPATNSVVSAPAFTSPAQWTSTALGPYTPVEFPDYVDPGHLAVFAPQVTASGVDGFSVLDDTADESGLYYYLRWESLSPVASTAPLSPDPPGTRLTVQRTRCMR